MSHTTAFRRAGAPAVLLAAGLLLASCSVNPALLLRKDGSAAVTARVTAAKPFLEYVLSVADVIGMKDLARQGRIYDLKEVQKGLEARPGIKVKSLSSPAPEILDVELAFQSVVDLFAKDPALKGSGILTISEAGGKKTMRLRLDRQNFRQIQTLFPILDNAMFSGMGPQANEGTSEEDYLAMMEYALGADGPAAIGKAAIDLSVKVEGEILSQTGGSLAGGVATFHIPLLRLLLLDKPIDLSVTYR